MGARLRPRRFTEGRRHARQAIESPRGLFAGCRRGDEILSGVQLVHDDEYSAGAGFRRHDGYPQGRHSGALAPSDEQHRLHRLPSARSGIDAHDPGCIRPIQIGGGSVGAPRCLRPDGRLDDEPARRAARRRAVQVFRRLDRSRGQGRAAQAQAAATAGCRAQHRHHLVGVEYRQALSARPGLLGSALPDRQRPRCALWVARVRDRQHGDPGSQDAQGDVLQDAGRGSECTRIVRASLPCLGRREADAALGVLGRGEDLEPAGQQPQRHVRQEGPGAGWVNTKVWDETGDAARAQGWAPWVLDTNGNGKLDEWTEPDKPAEAGKDTRIAGSGPYAVMPHPTDGSVWYTFNVFVGRPGFVRFDPKTKLSEFYAVPKEGLGVRGGDIDKDGVLWGSGSNGSLISFDRRKCKAPLNGPQATGDHCPEGFAFHKYPGPGFDGFENTSAEASYYTWVDHHNTAGLGDNVPISTANLQDGFVAFKDGKMILMRVPYPMGFYAKGLDGRIDDPNAGWKGRGLWSSSGDRTPWLMEGGKGSKPRAVHIQVRPDPLAH